MVKNIYFLLGGTRFKSKGGRVYTLPLTLTVKSLHGGGPLSHKKGGLIHQFSQIWGSHYYGKVPPTDR
jgi:hypothetical protein